jgi:hypothetical protein
MRRNKTTLRDTLQIGYGLLGTGRKADFQKTRVSHDFSPFFGTVRLPRISLLSPPGGPFGVLNGSFHWEKSGKVMTDTSFTL